jgi:hypothetical protein
MSNELIQKRKILLQKQFETYDNYVPCLRAHATEIVTALQNEDVEALIVVFKECKIPKKAWLKLIIQLKQAYDSEFQSWVVGK